MVLIAGTAILNKGKILLVQSKEGEQTSRWGPPAGHQELGETAEETAIRETKEETNLDVKLMGILQIGYFFYKEKDYLVVFYLAKAKSLKNLKLQEEEASDYAWASLSDLKKDKYILRKKFLKEPILSAFTTKPVKTSFFKTYQVEKD